MALRKVQPSNVLVLIRRSTRAMQTPSETASGNPDSPLNPMYVQTSFLESAAVCDFGASKANNATQNLKCIPTPLAPTCPRREERCHVGASRVVRDLQ